MPLYMHFISSMFATLGFSIIFSVPAKKIPACILVGAFGWTTYQFSVNCGYSVVVSCFIGSCVVGLLSDAASRLLKEASTIFIIPGIVCLVPGARIYYTMVSFLEHDTEALTNNATTTLMMAGAIAAGLLVIGSALQMARSLARKTFKQK